MTKKNISLALCIIVLVIAVVFRLYKITTPLVEFHSWRQADTLAVARNFAIHGFDLLRPTYDDLSSLQSGKLNPLGLRFVEFPIFNALIAIFHLALPIVDFVLAGRILTLAFGTLATWLVYKILEREISVYAAFVGSLVFATFPFFVFYTRTVLPDVPSMALSLLAVYTMYRSHGSLKYVFLSALLYGLAILIKPTSIFMLIPLFFVSQFAKPKLGPILKFALIFGVFTLPLIAWRMYIQSHPEAIPASGWLITSVNNGQIAESIMFRPAFFRWMIYERLNIMILGSAPLLLFVVGAVSCVRSRIIWSLALGSLAYVLTFQGGNVQHEYYQILALPAIALLTGLGAHEVLHLRRDLWGKIMLSAGTFCILALGFYMSYDRVRHNYYSLSDIPQFAKIVGTLTSKDDLIVTDTAGDTTVLYAFDRRGAPAIYTDPVTLKSQGYKYLFTYNLETAENLMRDFGITRVFGNSRFVLLKL